MFVWTRSRFSDNFIIFFMVFRCFLANIFTKYSTQIMTRLFARSEGGSWLVPKFLNCSWESNESARVVWETATAEADRNAVWEGDCWTLQQVIHQLFLFLIRSHHGNVVSTVWTTTRAAESQTSRFLRQQFFPRVKQRRYWSLNVDAKELVGQPHAMEHWGCQE